MLQPRFFLKEADLRAIPSSVNRVLPMLFVEPGKMPKVNRGEKTCLIHVSVAGITFLRYSTSKPKVRLFLSTYLIESITWINPQKREIRTAGLTTWFSCKHADDAISWILGSRQALFVGMIASLPISLINFPVEPTTPSDLISPDTLPQHRYICYSYRYSLVPADSFLSFFQNLSPEFSDKLTLDDRLTAPEHLKVIVLPLVQLPRVRIVHFKRFSPYAVCRLTHCLLKHCTGLRTVLFEGYSHCVPSQLRMQKLAGKHPYNFIIMNCSFTAPVFSALMQQLSLYGGEYQRFTLRGLEFGPRHLESLFLALESARPFRTLEILELDGLRIQAPSEASRERVRDVLEHCRFLTRVSLSGWLGTIEFAPFTRLNCLAETAFRI
jgi:hypothetical protein